MGTPVEDSRQTNVRLNPAIIAEADFRYVRDFLSGDEADELLWWMLREVCWAEERVRMFGREVRVPRLVAWFGEPGLNYRYSNRDHPASGWPDALLPVIQRLADHLPVCPDFALLNRYRSGADYMGWHADDEDMACDLIGSLSLGACRRFLLREGSDTRSRQLDLAHGSLLVMNRNLRHCLPRTRRAVGERVNISFRVLT